MSNTNLHLYKLERLLNALAREQKYLDYFSDLRNNAEYAQKTLQPMRRLQRRRFMKGLLRKAKNDTLTNDEQRIISGITDFPEEFSKRSRRDVIKLGRNSVNGGLTNRLSKNSNEVINSYKTITDLQNLINTLKSLPQVEEIRRKPIPQVDRTDLSSFKSFGEAFREARKRRLTEFKWKKTNANPSGRFSTELASPMLDTSQDDTYDTTSSESTTDIDETEVDTTSSETATDENETNTTPSESTTTATDGKSRELSEGNRQNSLNNNSTAKSTSNTTSSRSVGVGNINYGTANSTIGAEFVIPLNNYTRNTRKTSKGSPPPKGWSKAVTLPVDGSKLSLIPPQTDVWSRVGWLPIFRGTLDANGEFILK